MTRQQMQFPVFWILTCRNLEIKKFWDQNFFVMNCVSSSFLNLVQSYVLNRFLPWWSCHSDKKSRDLVFILHVKVVKLVIKINCCGLRYFTQKFLLLVMFPKYIQFWWRNYLFIICCVADKNWKLELPSWQN